MREGLFKTCVLTDRFLKDFVFAFVLTFACPCSVSFIRGEGTLPTFSWNVWLCRWGVKLCLVSRLCVAVARCGHLRVWCDSVAFEAEHLCARSSRHLHCPVVFLFKVPLLRARDFVFGGPRGAQAPKVYGCARFCLSSW